MDLDLVIDYIVLSKFTLSNKNIQGRVVYWLHTLTIPSEISLPNFLCPVERRAGSTPAVATLFPPTCLFFFFYSVLNIAHRASTHEINL